MQLIFSGISFHDATLQQREPLAFSEQQQCRTLCAIREHKQVHEGFILCTCNRTEFYLYVEDGYDGFGFIESLIEKADSKALIPWRTCHHRKTGTEAVCHLFTVASGLDSQMIGENQIIRQVKDAYAAAIEAGTTKFFFHRLMHSAFRVSKAVRTQTDINCGAVSISAAAVELAMRKLSLAGKHVLLLGAGENITVAAGYLIKAGIGSVTIASRTLESATELAARLKMGRVCTLEQLPECLAEADLVLCSTASPSPIITVENSGELLSRRTAPIFMIDIAVPRDVEPAVGEIGNVQLYNIEDLDAQVQENLKRRSTHIPEAMQIVDTHVRHFEEWLRGLSVTEIVKSLVEQYQDMAHGEAERYSRLFPDLNPQELKKFSESLANKILHGPVSYLKQSSHEELASDQLAAMDVVKKMLLDHDRKRGGQ